MPDPASSDLPDVALLVRMANEMFRAVPQSGIPGGMPAGTTRSLGGFGAAPPSVPLPEPPAQLVVAPAATQGSVGRPLGGLGVSLPSVPLAEVPPVDVSVPAGVPGVAGPSFSGFSVPIPSATLPEVPSLVGSPSSANGIPTGFPAPLPGMAFPAIPPSALPPVGTVPGGGPAGIPTGTGSLGGFGAALPSAPVWMIIPGAALHDSAALPPGLRLMLSALTNADRLVVTVGLAGQGLDAKMEATCRSKDDAHVLASQLRSVTAKLKEALQQEKQAQGDELLQVLVGGTFDDRGALVDGTWPFSRSLIASLTAGI